MTSPPKTIYLYHYSMSWQPAGGPPQPAFGGGFNPQNAMGAAAQNTMAANNMMQPGQQQQPFLSGAMNAGGGGAPQGPTPAVSFDDEPPLLEELGM